MISTIAKIMGSNPSFPINDVPYRFGDMIEWTCPSCKTKLDRDLNASKNILKEGIKIISVGTIDYRCGDEIRPTLVGTIGETSKKKELVSGNLSVFSR